ncbi:MAG: hypothetical protein K0S41_236 [Anaerocolumna sp.]|jgi:hypothetical protein|nr:hypothetical protein [Anaerocolumna sp.]
MAIELEKRDLRSYELRKRKHKQVITAITIVAIIISLGLIGFFVKLFLNKNYSKYEVLHSMERSDTSFSRYESYGSGILKYSKDGAMAMDGAGNLLWNGPFEMKDPIVDITGKYVALADRGYDTIHIFNGNGGMETVNTNNRIIKIEVANQGVVAALLDGPDVNYIQLYTEEGSMPVDIRTLNEKDGYPVDIALSQDGRKLVTSYVSILNGVTQSKVTFYNFGGVGQNYIGKVVGGFDFGQTIVPDVDFINNDTVCAFGDDKFSIYSMKEKPELVYEEKLSAEVKSIIHSEKYVGLVLNNDGEEKNRIVIYDLKGKVIFNETTNLDYNKIFISGDEVIAYSDNEWNIWNLSGSKKFHYTFDANISYILPVNNVDKYILVDDTSINEIKLLEN